MIKSAIISFSGDSGVGIPNATFELTGGDFILDPEIFCDPEMEVEGFRKRLAELCEDFLGDGKAYVFLNGYDKEPEEPEYENNSNKR